MLNIWLWIMLWKYLHYVSVKLNAHQCDYDYSYHPEMTSNKARNFLYYRKCVSEQWDGNTNFIIAINSNG